MAVGLELIPLYLNNCAFSLPTPLVFDGKIIASCVTPLEIMALAASLYLIFSWNGVKKPNMTNLAIGILVIIALIVLLLPSA